MKRRGRMERFLFLTFLVIFSLALICRYLNIQADPMPGIDVATLTTFLMWRIIKIETELDKLKKEGD